MEGNKSIKEKGCVCVALLHGVVREDCVDKAMTSKERPERRRNWRESNQGIENSKDVNVAKI